MYVMNLTDILWPLMSRSKGVGELKLKILF